MSRWRSRLRKIGSVSAAATGGDRRSRRIEEYAELILARMHAQPDTTLEEYHAVLCETGQRFPLSTIWRFLSGDALRIKKDCTCRRTGASRCSRGATRMD